MGVGILLFAPRKEVREALLRGLEHSPCVDLLEVAAGEEELERALASARFDVACIELGADAQARLAWLEQLPGPLPALILAGGSADPALLVQAMRLRPEAFLADGDLRELAPAVERVAAVRVSRPGARGVLALSSVKGGVGTTLAACELGGWLARSGARTCVVDLDLYQGDVALYLDLEPPHTLADIARKGDQIDGEFLRMVAAQHTSGVSVIAAPSELEDARLLRPRQLERVVAWLRREFDFVLLDVGGAWDELALRALDLADLALLFSSLEVAAVTRASARRKLLLRLGAPEDRVRIALRQGGHALSSSDFARALGRAPDFELPYAPEVAEPATNHGRSVHALAPACALDRAFAELAVALHGWLELPAPALALPTPTHARFAAPFLKFRHSLKGLRHASAE